MKHAPEPLCKICGEDRYDLVQTTKDKGRVTVHCSVCGKSWSPDVRDAQGNQMEGGLTGP